MGPRTVVEEHESEVGAGMNEHIKNALSQLDAIDAEDEEGRTLLGRLEEAIQAVPASHEAELAAMSSIPRNEWGYIQRSAEYAAFRAMQRCRENMALADSARQMLSDALTAASNALVDYQLTWEDTQ
jgi:hypothetical protein